MEEARKKIEAEMAKSTNPQIKHLGKLLLRRLEANPQWAAAILTEGKTLKGAMDKMRSEAQKAENGGIVSDEDGVNVALKYFGVTTSIATEEPAPQPMATKPAHVSVQRTSAFDVDLDDLLGGL